MLTRRTLLTACATLAMAPNARAGGNDVASQLIDKLLHDLIAVVNGPGSIEDKRAALAKIVDNTVDVTSVAQFCLGRFWRLASAAQQREYTDLFHAVLVNSVTSKVGDYRGDIFTIGRSIKRDDDGFVVPTVLTRPGNAPNKVDWLVSTASGSPKLVDVIAEGVSLRLTQRDDYAAYLARNNNNVQALIDAMRQQAEATPG